MAADRIGNDEPLIADLGRVLMPRFTEIIGRGIMRRISLAALALAFSATVAIAQGSGGKHPLDVAAIDAALRTAKITPSQRAEVVKYRNEGERAHNAGQHGQAEQALRKAKSILKI